jgi:hypothetical protein
LVSDQSTHSRLSFGRNPAEQEKCETIGQDENKKNFVIYSYKTLLRSNKVKLVIKPISFGMSPVNLLFLKFKDAGQKKEMDGQAKDERHIDNANLFVLLDAERQKHGARS